MFVSLGKTLQCQVAKALLWNACSTKKTPAMHGGKSSAVSGQWNQYLGKALQCQVAKAAQCQAKGKT